MEKLFRIFLVSVVSVGVVSSLAYASSTIISVQTQSIAQGDVIANGWFQEVNDSIVSIRNTLTSNTGNVWGKNGNDIYYTGGNVGIGTGSPKKKLDINGKSDDGIRVTAEGKMSTAYLHIAGGDYGYLALSSLSGVELPTDTVLRSGGNESRIGGKVSINGSSPINPDVRAIYGASLEYPYYYEITVNGDKDTFYPVALTQGWTGRIPGKFIVSRTYSDQGPQSVAGNISDGDNWHHGGLMASFSTEGSCWSDYCYIILERYRTTYARLIADAGQLPAADNANHVVWIRLRGGGFKYRIYANWAADPIQPVPGSTAYNQNGYVFNYPSTIGISALINNAFATNQNLPTENLQ